MAELLERSARAQPGTFAALIQAREEQADRSANTRDRERPIVARIRADFGGRRVEDVTAGDLADWLARLRAEGRSGSTVQRYWAVLRWMLRRAEAHEWIRRSPDRGVTERPRAAEVEAVIPDAEAVRVLTAAAAARSRDLGVAVRLATHAGLRAGELVALRWRDVGETGLRVRHAVQTGPGGMSVLGPTKGRRARTVTLDEATLGMLADHRRWVWGLAKATGAAVDDRCFVVADRRAEPAGRQPSSPRSLSKRWARLASRAGHGEVTFHSLRHYHASVLLARDVRLEVVSRRLGHRDQITTARIYAHLLRGADDAAAAAMGDHG